MECVEEAMRRKGKEKEERAWGKQQSAHEIETGMNNPISSADHIPGRRGRGLPELGATSLVPIWHSAPRSWTRRSPPPHSPSARVHNPV